MNDEHKKYFLLPIFPLLFLAYDSSFNESLWAEGVQNLSIIKSPQTIRKVIIHDGPPFANGCAHLGHIFNKIIKDFYVRYHISKKHNTKFIMGWDCHGIKIENQVDKNYFYDNQKTRDKCTQIANYFMGEQLNAFNQMGIHNVGIQYKTSDFSYCDNVMRNFNDLIDKNLITYKHQSMFYDISTNNYVMYSDCEYKIINDYSIYFKLPTNIDNTFFLVWTTSPWTIPANFMIGISKKIEYNLFLCDGEWIIARKE